MKENKKNSTDEIQNSIVKGKIANALTSAAMNHIVATTDDLYDQPIGKYQEEINAILSGATCEHESKIQELSATTQELFVAIYEINSKIPEEASDSNQLADKEYVLNLIAKSSSYFRGSWHNWSGVPESANEYPEDPDGNRKPKLGDYIVIEDASDYTEESGLTGTWRFTYNGDWETNNKDGWKPEYQINEEAEKNIHFRKRKEGEEISTPITDVKITENNTLLDYPELDYSEFVDGGYWDTNITTLRNITGETTVYYITPFITSDENRILLKICYENGWSSSPDYLTLNEVQNITDEMVKEAAKKLAVIEDENGNIIHVFDSIIYEEDEGTNIVMADYNLYDDTCRDKDGNEYNITDCYCYSKDGKKYGLDEVKYGNCFYELETWAELPYFTGITSLGDGETYRVFLDYSKIRDINLENITSLPAYTLFRCTNLENIFIPSGLTDIETYTIASCDGLQSLTVDDNNPVYTSRDSNGNECNCIIDKATVSGELDLIQGCNVSTIPDNTTKISSGAFDECTGIHSITIPNTVREIGDNVFRGCTGLNTKVTIPSTVDSIGDYTFKGCTNLPAVECNVENISEQLFKDCTSLSSVTLNNTVSIDNQAFMNCSSLTAITIPDSVTVAGTSAFANCDLRSVNTNNIETISANLFAHNYNLSSVTMTDSTVNIGDYAFYMTTITGITIPQNIRNISNTAFEACYYLKTVIWDVNDTNMSKYISPFSPVDGDYQITSFEFGEHCTVIPNQLCRSLDGLEEIVIPNHITKIGNEAFAWCNSLVHLTIPDSVSYVGLACFGGCTSLETVTIGSGVTTIPTSCFVSCSSLETVDLSNNPNKIDLTNINAFQGCDNLSIIIVPDDLIAEYRESQDWYDYRELIFGSSIYTITFDSMSGETTPSVQYVRCGAYIENPGRVHKDLYEFEYWEDENGYQWDFDEDYVIGDMTLYAHYREVKAIMVKSISSDVTYISMGYNGSYPTNVEYSYDGLNWYNIWNNNYLTISLSEGYSDYVYFRGYNPNGFSRDGGNYTQFNINNGQCDLLGNIMCLKDYNEELNSVGYYEFYSLFQNCYAIVNTVRLKLPATTLTSYCYYYMFNGCSSLTTAPELPATTLAFGCYSYMFSNCTSLTTAPELPATELTSYCYAGMFYNCTSLNYIKCLAVDGINTNYSTSSWVYGVQTDIGTFVKHPDATDWTPDNNGIPDNWTIENAVIE